MSEEFENIKENVEEIKDEIRDEVKQAAEAVEAEVKAAEEEVKEAAEAAEAKVDEAEKTAEEKKEEFKQKVDEMKSDVKEAYENAKEGAAAAFATAKEKAQSTVENIKSEIDDYSDEMDPDDVNKNKLMAVLAYIGPLVIIPILVAKDSKFAKFHANQGLILFLIALVCSLLTKLKLLGWLFSVCGAVVFILAVVGIIYACQGKAKELPVVGNWKILN